MIYSSNGFTQVVEAGGYRPNTDYTLSIDGTLVNTRTSPASGNWNIAVSFGAIPFNSRRVQLEEGTVVTPFEIRPFALEMQMCYRYFQKLDFGIVGAGMTTSSAGRSTFFVPFPNGEMRTAPTCARATGTKAWRDSAGVVVTGTQTMSKHAMQIDWATGNATSGGRGDYLRLITAGGDGRCWFDAEL